MSPIISTLCAVLLFGVRAIAQYSNGTITSSSGESYPVPAISQTTPSSTTTTSSYVSSSLQASGLSTNSMLPYVSTEQPQTTLVPEPSTDMFSFRTPHTEISRTALDVPSSSAPLVPEAVTSVVPADGSTVSTSVASTTALPAAEVVPVGAVNGTTPLPLGPGTGVSSSTGLRPTTTPLATLTTIPVVPEPSNATSSTPEPVFSYAPETSSLTSASTSSVLFSYAPAPANTQSVVATSSPSSAIFSYAPASAESSGQHFATATPSKNDSTFSIAPAFTYDHKATIASSGKASTTSSASLGLMTVSINPFGEVMLGSFTLRAGSTMTQGYGARATRIALEEVSGSTALVVKAPHTTASAFLPKSMKPTSTPDPESSTSRVLEYDSGSPTLTKGKYEATGTAIAASETQSAASYPPGTLSNGASGSLVVSGSVYALLTMLLGTLVLL